MTPSRDFYLAGDAIFTVEQTLSSSGSGWWSFNVRQFTPNLLLPDGRWIVTFSEGSDNTLFKLQVATINIRNGYDTWEFAGPKMSCDPAFATLRAAFSVGHLLFMRNRPLPPGWAINLAGNCARCGRLLTTPDSVERGIGPDCLAIIARTNRRSALSAVSAVSAVSAEVAEIAEIAEIAEVAEIAEIAEVAEVAEIAASSSERADVAESDVVGAL